MFLPKEEVHYECARNKKQNVEPVLTGKSRNRNSPLLEKELSCFSFGAPNRTSRIDFVKIRI